MLRRIEWGVQNGFIINFHKERSFASNYFIFSKISSCLRTSSLTNLLHVIPVPIIVPSYYTLKTCFNSI